MDRISDYIVAADGRFLQNWICPEVAKAMSMDEQFKLLRYSERVADLGREEWDSEFVDGVSVKVLEKDLIDLTAELPRAMGRWLAFVEAVNRKMVLDKEINPAQEFRKAHDEAVREINQAAYSKWLEHHPEWDTQHPDWRP